MSIRYFKCRHSATSKSVRPDKQLLITSLVLERERLNYAEQLTANMRFISVSNLLFALLVLLLRSLTANSPGGGGPGFLLQILYLWWSLNGVLGLDQPGLGQNLLL
jgi:hypothetical protein